MYDDCQQSGDSLSKSTYIILRQILNAVFEFKFEFEYDRINTTKIYVGRILLLLHTQNELKFFLNV